MKQLMLKVNGMHCAACEAIITEALEDAGATHVQADAAAGTVILEFDEKKLKETRLKELIREEGYEVA